MQTNHSFTSAIHKLSSNRITQLSVTCSLFMERQSAICGVKFMIPLDSSNIAKGGAIFQNFDILKINKMATKLEKEGNFTECKKCQKTARSRAGQMRSIDTNLRIVGAEMPKIDRIMSEFGQHISNLNPL